MALIGASAKQQIPRFAGYVVTFAAEVAITAALRALHAHFPLGGYPIPYIVLMMVVAYAFGEGPAALALVMGFVAFTFYFVPPEGFWPLADNPENWAKLAAFVLGTLAVGLATSLARRSHEKIRRLAEELDLAGRIAEQRKSELETILKSMSGGVVVTDTSLSVVYANPSAMMLVPMKRDLGQSIAEWIRIANVRTVEGEPLDVGQHPVTSALQGNNVSERLFLVNGRSGPDTVIGATAAPIRDENGAISGAVVVIRDVTSQVRMQTEIEEQRAQLDTLISDVPIGIAFLDRDLRYTIINPAMGDMFDLNIETSIGKRPTQMRAATASAEMELVAGEVMASGQPVSWHEYEMANDKYFDIEFLPVQAAEGELLGVGIVTVDTTDRVKARRVLETSYERERRIAEALQTNLLGSIPQRVGPFRFESTYHAAMDEARVGGDFYDVFSIGEDKVAIVIGDVSGKGLNSAVQMAVAKYCLRGRAYSDDGPAAMLAQLNRTMSLESGPESFVTAFVGILECSTRRLTYANGGHEPVLVWVEHQQRVMQLEPTGPIAGIIDDASYGECGLQLVPGDEILLATDGLVEVKCTDHYLDVQGLIDIYTDRKLGGTLSAEGLVTHISEICSTTLRDDTAVLRVIVE
jgi:PAS domain-containing protein